MFDRQKAYGYTDYGLSIYECFVLVSHHYMALSKDLQENKLRCGIKNFPNAVYEIMEKLKMPVKITFGLRVRLWSCSVLRCNCEISYALKRFMNEHSDVYNFQMSCLPI